MDEYYTEEYCNKNLIKNVNSLSGQIIEAIYQWDEFVIISLANGKSLQIWDEGGDYHSELEVEIAIPDNIIGAVVRKLKKISSPERQDSGQYYIEERIVTIDTSAGKIKVSFEQTYPYKQTDFLIRSWVASSDEFDLDRNRVA